MIKKHQQTRSVQDCAGRGRKRKTRKRQDRQIVQQSLRNRRLTSSDLRRSLEEQNGVTVTARTIRNRLREVGLKGCVAAKKPLLSTVNHKARLTFARGHKGLSQSGITFSGLMRALLKFLTVEIEYLSIEDLEKDILNHVWPLQ